MKSSIKLDNRCAECWSLPADCPTYVTPVMSEQRKEAHKYTYKLCWQYTGKKEYTRPLEERLRITEHTV